MPMAPSFEIRNKLLLKKNHIYKYRTRKTRYMELKPDSKRKKNFWKNSDDIMLLKFFCILKDENDLMIIQSNIKIK